MEVDYMLLSDEGHEKLKNIIISQKKQNKNGPIYQMDHEEEMQLRQVPFSMGTTACVCLITKTEIYCANSGDSRAILVSKAGMVFELSHDHKPEVDTEIKRIKAAGGFVEDNRVQGVIAVSRAIGDWEYKNTKLNVYQGGGKKPKKAKKKEDQLNETGPYRKMDDAKKHKVSSFPDIKQLPFDKENFDFIVIACDGIWDCFTNEQVA